MTETRPPYDGNATLRVHTPATARIAAFLGLSYERAWELPLDVLCAVEAAMERGENEKHAAYNCGWTDGRALGSGTGGYEG